MSEFTKDINVPNRKGVFIPDITVEMLRNASLEGVEELMASGEMEDISLPSAQQDRDIPMKPLETTDKAWGIPRRQAVCPKCDYYLGHVAFLSDHKDKRVTYCETCGQAIDWEGWGNDEHND